MVDNDENFSEIIIEYMEKVNKTLRNVPLAYVS